MSKRDPSVSSSAKPTADSQSKRNRELDWGDALVEVPMVASKTKIFFSGQTAFADQNQLITCGLNSSWEAAIDRSFKAPEFAITKVERLVEIDALLVEQSQFASALIAIHVELKSLQRVCQKVSTWLRDHRLDQQRLIAIRAPVAEAPNTDSSSVRNLLSKAGFIACIESFGDLGRFLRFAARHFQDIERRPRSLESIEQKVARNLPW